MTTKLIKLPFTVPASITNNSFTLVLDRNFRELEQVLGMVQIDIATTDTAELTARINLKRKLRMGVRV